MHENSFRALSLTPIAGFCQAKKKRIEGDPQIAQISQTGWNQADRQANRLRAAAAFLS
jgi:hypothetical protein